VEVLWLTQLLVFHDCTQDYTYKGRPGLLQQLPPHKLCCKQALPRACPLVTNAGRGL
jgi:hypothetical protein